MNRKDKFKDVDTMQREKHRLELLCRQYEEKLSGHWNELKANPVKTAVGFVLPFEAGMRDQVIKGLGLFNETILPVILGASFKKGQDSWTRNLMQIGQALLVAWAFKFFKRMMEKKSETT
jgi:hypothetical protein